MRLICRKVKRDKLDGSEIKLAINEVRLKNSGYPKPTRTEVVLS
jgi:hypothetical protein